MAARQGSKEFEDALKEYYKPYVIGCGFKGNDDKCPINVYYRRSEGFNEEILKDTSFQNREIANWVDADEPVNKKGSTAEEPRIIYDFLKFDTTSYPIPKLFVPFDNYEEAVSLYDAHLDVLEDDEWIMIKKSNSPYLLWSETIKCSRWEGETPKLLTKALNQNKFHQWLLKNNNSKDAPNDNVSESNGVEKGEAVGDHKGGESI